MKKALERIIHFFMSNVNWSNGSFNTW